ncbi:MAG: Glycogen debranching enzyme (Alpha-1,6-glucosidase), partial [uncultured Rubrobacteraceae bacterium]
CSRRLAHWASPVGRSGPSSTSGSASARTWAAESSRSSPRCRPTPPPSP